MLAAATELLGEGLVEGTSGNVSGRVDDGTGVPDAVVARLRRR